MTAESRRHPSKIYHKMSCGARKERKKQYTGEKSIVREKMDWKSRFFSSIMRGGFLVEFSKRQKKEEWL